MDSVKKAACVAFRNPGLLIASIAWGLLMTSGGLVYSLVVGPLKTEIWQHQQSQFSAEVSMAQAVFATISSYFFGSFADRMGYKLAALIYGFVNLVPAWFLFFIGLNERGLWTFMWLSVVSGLASSSNVMLVLANAVTDPSDREIGFGVFYSLSTLISLLGSSIPMVLIVIFQIVPNSPLLAIQIQFGLSMAFFLLVVLIRMPVAERGESKVAVKATEGCCEVKPLLNTVTKVFVGPLALVWRVPSLRFLCFMSVLLAVSSDLPFDIGGQFFMESLDLISHGSLRDQQLVSVLSMLPVQIVNVIAPITMGFLCKRFSPLSVLKLWIPFSACMILIGAGMRWFPYFWFIPILCIGQNLASLANLPLNILITNCSPEGRLGEVMGVVGTSNQLLSFVCNALVAVINPPLMNSGLQNPLWLYYPACAILKLLAIAPMLALTATKPMSAKDESLEDVSPQVAAGQFKPTGDALSVRENQTSVVV